MDFTVAKNKSCVNNKFLHVLIESVLTHNIQKTGLTDVGETALTDVGDSTFWKDIFNAIQFVLVM